MSHKIIVTVMGLYYLITGLWPVVHLASFEKFTGPKQNHWLVKTVSLMLISSSVLFLNPMMMQHEPSQDIILLAKLNAISLFF